MNDSTSKLRLIASTSRVAGLLVHECILLGGGPLSSCLTVAEQARIDKIFLIDIHLDYIGDIAFMVDSCFGQRQSPFEVWAHPKLIELFKRHFFNNAVWPDFSAIPSPERPTLTFHEFKAGERTEWKGIEIEALSGDEKGEELLLKVTVAGKSFLYSSKKHSRPQALSTFYADDWQSPSGPL